MAMEDTDTIASGAVTTGYLGVAAGFFWFPPVAIASLVGAGLQGIATAIFGTHAMWKAAAKAKVTEANLKREQAEAESRKARAEKLHEEAEKLRYREEKLQAKAAQLQAEKLQAEAEGEKKKAEELQAKAEKARLQERAAKLQAEKLQAEAEAEKKKAEWLQAEAEKKRQEVEQHLKNVEKIYLARLPADQRGEYPEPELLKDWTKWYMQEYKFPPTCIAIVGNSGLGKSSLCNLLRGIKPLKNDNETRDIFNKYAPTGSNETSMEPICYPWRPNPNGPPILLFDIPGCNTEKFKREDYIREMGIKWYNWIVIVESSRMTETGTMLSDECQMTKDVQRGKYITVRTKIDIDMDNDKGAIEYRGQTFNQGPWLDEMRVKTMAHMNPRMIQFTEQLSRKGHPIQSVYLVNTKEYESDASKRFGVFADGPKLEQLFLAFQDSMMKQ